MVSRKIYSLSLLVGENIARRRKQLGMTQDDLAEKLQMSSSAMSRIESGSGYTQIFASGGNGRDIAMSGGGHLSQE